MAISGEIGHVGSTCKECGVTMEARVLSSNAGYYVGTMCDCGPYSRETGYFKTQKEAEAHRFLIWECGAMPIDPTVLRR